VRGDFQRDEEIRQQEDHLEEQFAHWGIERDDTQVLPDLEPFFLWPEHVEPYMLFASLRSQFRHGFNGPTGMDYGAVLAHMHAVRIPKRKFDAMYEAVRIMEQGALIGFAELRQEPER
jgi:hypothetical protein